jgi:patatin-like phospholipase/acyl hydrolase
MRTSNYITLGLDTSSDISTLKTDHNLHNFYSFTIRGGLASSNPKLAIILILKQQWSLLQNHLYASSTL